MNLETLYILFKAETADLKKGLNEAQKEIDKVQDSLKKTDKATNNLGNSFLKTTQSAVNFLAASTAGIYAITHFKNAVDFGIELSRTSKVLGVSAGDLNAWGNAVELAGGDAKQFQNTLSSLSAKWGASPSNVLKALPRYGDLFSRLNPARAQQIGSQLGLDEGTILLLQQGRREVEDLIKRQKDLGVVTDFDAEKFNHYRESITKANQASQVFFNHLALDAIPILEKLENYKEIAFKYADKHREAFGFAGAAIGGLGAAAALKKLAGYIGLGRFAGGGAGALLAAPLIYEDVSKYRKGAKGTITGKIFNGEIKEDISEFATLLFQKAFKETIKSLVNFQSTPLLNSFHGQSSVNNSPQVTYNLGPTTINTQAQNGEDLLSDLLNYTNGQFAQATNHFITPLTS